MEQKNKFSLRLSADIFEKISYLAEYNSRSINREIESAIRRYIRDFERLNGEIETKSGNKAE